MSREKSTVSRLTREKSSVVSRPAAGGPGKRPAWDVKGRLEDMERVFEETRQRVADLETEKMNLQTDNEVKLEVVTQTTKEASELRKLLGGTDSNLGILNFQKLLLFMYPSSVST